MKKWIVLLLLLIPTLSLADAVRLGGIPSRAQMGVDNVDNTSDVNKPVSTYQATAINAKADKAQGFNNFSAAYLTKIRFNNRSTAVAGQLAGKQPSLGTFPAGTVLAGPVSGGTATPTARALTAGEVGAAKDKAASDEVYATDYNGGVLTSATINAAITAIGSNVKTLVVTPGDWAVSTDITTPSTVMLRVQAGAKLVRTSGTLTINGPLDAPQRFWLSGFTGGTLAFGSKISDAYTDWIETTGDGVTDDAPAVCAILRAGSNIDVRMNGTKKHLFSSECQIRNDGVRLWGNNATIVSTMESTNATLFFGGWKSNTTGISVSVVSGARTLAIPNGVSVSKGDMVVAYSSTPYSTSGSNYYRGALTEVISINGNTATISIPSKETFTADIFAVWYPAKGTEVHDLKFDNSASTNQTRALMVQAKDFTLSNVEAIGSLYAGAGISLEGIRGTAEHINSHGYFGQAASCLTGGGGRPCGYSATMYGHNVVITKSSLSDSKHTVSMCKGLYSSENLSVEYSTLSQDPTLFAVDGAGASGNLFQMALDMHNNCSDITVSNNTIEAAGQNAAIGIRNAGKGVRFYGNTISYANSNVTPYSIFGVGDSNLSALQLTDNTISALATSTPIVAAYDGVSTADPAVIKMSNNVMPGISFSGSFACSGTDKMSGFNAATGVYTCTPDTGNVSDTVYGTEWNGDTTSAPSRNAVYDKIEALVAGGGMVYPTAGVPNSTGSAWGTSYTVGTGASNLVQLNASSQLPAVSGALLTNLPSQINQSSVTVNASSTSNATGVSITRGAPDFAAASVYSTLDISSTYNAASPDPGSTLRAVNLATFYGGAGTLPAIYSVFASPRNTGTGTVTEIDGFTTWIRNTSSGSVPNMRSFYAKAPSNSGTAPLNSYAFHSENMGLTGATNSYGLKIDNQSGSTNNYAIYTGTGKHSFGDVIDSRVTTGTAPFSVASTTKVANLNVEQVDGHDLDQDVKTTSSPTFVSVVAKTFTPTIPAAATDGATVTFDLSAGDRPNLLFTSGVGSNRAIAFSNPQTGWYTLKLKQAASGGPYTVTWPSTGLVCTFIKADGTTTTTGPTLHTAANTVDTIVMSVTSATTADCYAAGY